TLIQRGADDRIRADAESLLAAVALRARIAVIAGGAVRLRRLRTDARRGVAGADVVALIESGADDRIAAGTDSSLAGVGLRARIAVVTRRAVRLRWIRTDTGRGVARAGVVALIGSRAHDRIAAGTDSSLAGVGLRARIAVVARRAVRLRWIRT